MSKGYRKFAYTSFGRYLEPLLPRFEGLGKNLRKAGMEVSLRMYLATGLLTSLLYFNISCIC